MTRERLGVTRVALATISETAASLIDIYRFPFDFERCSIQMALSLSIWRCFFFFLRCCAGIAGVDLCGFLCDPLSVLECSTMQSWASILTALVPFQLYSNSRRIPTPSDATIFSTTTWEIKGGNGTATGWHSNLMNSIMMIEEKAEGRTRREKERERERVKREKITRRGLKENSVRMGLAGDVFQPVQVEIGDVAQIY